MVTEQLLWMIPGIPIAILILLLILVGFIWQLGKICRNLYKGKEEKRTDHLLRRLGFVLGTLLVPRRLYRDRYHGIIHTLIFWGFIFLIPGTVDTIWKGFSGGQTLSVLNIGVLQQLVNWWDVIAVFPAVGVVFAMLRRLVKPPRRFATASVQVYLILLMIFFLLVAELARSGVDLSLSAGTTESGNPVRLGFSFLIRAFGLSSTQLTNVHSLLWWIHYLLLAGFVVYIPLSKHLHLLLCPFNLFFRDYNAGALPVIELVNNMSEKLGVSTLKDFTWKQKLDLYTCANCGRCEDRCPANLSGKTLSPRTLIQNLRHSLSDKQPVTGEPSNAKIDCVSPGWNSDRLPVSRQEIWACTTCGACQAECPNMVEHLRLMIDLRRGDLENGGLHPAGARALENIWRWGNPWGEPQTRRTQWLGAKENALRNRKGLLFWAGCTASFDPDGQEIAKAMVEILSRKEIEFMVLGPDEQCCGDPARRMGEEGLFQALARDNIRKFDELGITTLVTSCPHCYHVFKQEYPQLGAKLEVLHHTQFLELLLTETKGEQQPKSSAGNPGWTMTFHDPCYLGRYNDLYDAPRKLIQTLIPGNLVEMKDCRRDALCCGGGGGQLWIDVREGERINNMRFLQADGIGAELIVTACPACKIMLKSAKDSLNNDQIMVKDISEVILAHL